MYYDNQHIIEHKEIEVKITALEDSIKIIRSDLRAIKYLLFSVVASILGVGII